MLDMMLINLGEIWLILKFRHDNNHLKI